MFNLESAISDWRRQMSAGGIKTPAVLSELEAHLRDEVEQQMRSGLAAQPAFEIAIRHLGHAELLKVEFVKGRRARPERLRKNLLPILGLGLGLFLAGLCFCYYVMIPLTFEASRQYATWLGFNVSHSLAPGHLRFIFRFMLGTGFAFATPAGVLLLNRTGLLDYQKLAGLRRYVIVVNLILGALLTTPEVVTQLLMFIVLQSIYEATVWLCGHRERKAQHV